VALDPGPLVLDIWELFLSTLNASATRELCWDHLDGGEEGSGIMLFLDGTVKIFAS